MPQLDSIVGRNTDIIYTPKEKALIVHFFTAIFEHHSEIAQFKCFQQNKRWQYRYKLCGELELIWIFLTK